MSGGQDAGVSGVEAICLQYDLDPETASKSRYVSREVSTRIRQLRYWSQDQDHPAPAKA